LCHQWFKTNGTLALSIKLGQWKHDNATLRRRRQSYKGENKGSLYSWREKVIGSVPSYQEHRFAIDSAKQHSGDLAR